MYTYIHTYMHAYRHTYMHAYIRKFIHTYIHTYIHTLTHTHIQYRLSTSSTLILFGIAVLGVRAHREKSSRFPSD